MDFIGIKIFESEFEFHKFGMIFAVYISVNVYWSQAEAERALKESSSTKLPPVIEAQEPSEDVAKVPEETSEQKTEDKKEEEEDKKVNNVKNVNNVKM